MQGEAFERKNVKLDGNDPTNWCNGTSIYGTENNKGTPGSASSCFLTLPDCQLSEVTLDFGNVDFLTNSTLSATIYSTGTGTLVIDSLTMNGNQFTTNLTAQTISVGDSVNFTVTFAPTIEGALNDTLWIHTNDWNGTACEIALTGNGVDVVSPSAIWDFAVVEHNGTNLKLRWTATGDDSTDGTATNYEIRKSTNEITDANFSSATLVANPPIPSASGTLDSVSVSGLNSGTQYYFGIKVLDNVGNESDLVTENSFGRPEITSITDVQNDNGGSVRIYFNASFSDYNSSTGINPVQYAIYRKLNPNYSPSGKNNNQIYETLPSGNWEVVGTVPSFGDQSYITTVPTLADSNSTGTHEFEFLVRAQAFGNGAINSVSEVVSAYSIDNLPPAIPPNQNFVNNGNGTTTANWSSVTDSDLAFYTIWAEDSNGEFSQVTQVLPNGTGTQTETFNNVSGATSYLVGSVDVNGNESHPFVNRINSLEIEVVGNDVVLKWIGKPDATLYRIYRGLNPEFSNATQIGTFVPNGTEPSFIDVGASQNAEKYFYFVTWEN